MNKKILISLSVIGAVAAIVVGGTVAWFSDVETSTGNTFTAGTIDLKVNDKDTATLGALVTLGDMKPSQVFEVGKKLQVLDNPAKLYLHIKDIAAADCETNGVNEPECEAQGGSWTGTECTDGTEVKDLNTKVTYDLCIEVGTPNGKCDGDDIVIIPGDAHRKLIPYTSIEPLGVTSCWIPIKQVEQLEKVFIVQSFHLQGEETGNVYQSDKCTFTEEFKAVQVNAVDDPTPICPWLD